MIDVDLQAYFDNIRHHLLLTQVAQRVKDSDVLHVLKLMLKTSGTTGVPQGGVGSPVLAHVYLHDALDLWCDKVVKAHCRGEALLCRYADDWVCAFRDQDDAERFYRVLPKRLKKFNLQVAPEKTHRRRCSRFHPSMKRRVTFLGFAFAWMQIGTACHASCGAPRARSSKPPANG